MNNSVLSYKVLGFVNNFYSSFSRYERTFAYEVYSLESDSWKVVAVTTPEWVIKFYHRGLSLKGNTYWYAQEKSELLLGQAGVEVDDFLICFDFSSETFGPRIPLPFHSSPSSSEDTVTLSGVGEDQLAVLFQNEFTLHVEIWVTSNIEPKEVAWKKLFLSVDMTPLTGFVFLADAGSFFVDQKTNVAVVFDKDKDVSNTRSIAYIIGKNDYFKKVDLGESTDPFCYPLVCSYDPSSVQIQQLT